MTIYKYRDERNEWRWYLMSDANWKKLACSGEGYISEKEMDNTINLIKIQLPSANVRYRDIKPARITLKKP